MYEMNDLRQGVIISLNGEPYEVLWSDFMRTAQRKPVMRTKLRHLISGNILEQTLQPNDKIDEADLTRSKGAYLYSDEESHHFMDQESFEQFFISKKSLGEKAQYLKDGLIVDVMVLDGKPITVQLPKKVEYTVKDAPPGVKGDTATNVFKTVTLENGMELKVPLFINQGDVVRVNTESGEYTERVTN
jgi:elongation factor P